MTFWKRQNYEDSKKNDSCQRLEGKKDEQAGHRGLLGQWNHLYETIMTETCHYTFVQTHKMYNKSET